MKAWVFCLFSGTKWHKNTGYTGDSIDLVIRHYRTIRTRGFRSFAFKDGHSPSIVFLM